jgi:hypothetical protein
MIRVLLANDFHSGAGGAETREPERWADDALREIFRTEYTKTISHYYPYNATDIPTTPTSTAEEGNDGDGDDGLPDWVPPVLGVILGLVFIGIVAIGLLLWLRRRQSRYAPSEVPTENRNRILGWMYGVVQPTHKPEETVTSTEIGIYDKPVQSGLSEAGHDSVAFTNPTSTAVRSDDSNAQEAGGMGIHEMQGECSVSLSDRMHLLIRDTRCSRRSSRAANRIQRATHDAYFGKGQASQRHAILPWHSIATDLSNP